MLCMADEHSMNFNINHVAGAHSCMSVRIYQPSKSTTQSGKARNRNWLLEFVPEVGKSADPLMGWVSSADTRQQIRLQFPTQAAAIAYAKAKGLTFELIPTAKRPLKLQSYADNFR